MTTILFTAPQTAVEMAALIFCWLAVVVAAGVVIGLAFDIGLGPVILVVCIGVIIYEYNYPDPNPRPPGGGRVQPSQRVTAKPAEPRPLTDAEVGITPPPVRPRF
jgi:hypothetical protein